MADIGERLAQLSPVQREMLLKKLKKSGKSGKQSKVVIRENRDLFPVSFQQQQLWFLNQLDPNSSFYNMPAAVRMQGQLDMTALKKTLSDLCKRHEVLRAVFPIENGNVKQKILPEIEFDLNPYDVSGLSSSAFKKRIHREAQVPFDLSSGPLIRSKLYRHSETEHTLLITQHHIIADGWSIGIFVEDFAAFYSAHHMHKIPALIPLPVQYADYASWQSEWIKSEQKEKQAVFWEKRLSSVPHFLELPYDQPRPAKQTFNGAHISFTIPTRLLVKMRRSNKEHGVTLFMQLMAVFQTLLHIYSGSDDISVGTTVANRERPELSRLIGFFINTLIIHGDFSENPTYYDFLKQIKKSALDAFANQDLPFEHIVDRLQPERHSGYSPLFQVLFVLQNAPKGKLELPDLTLSLVETQLDSIKFDLTIILEEVDDQIKGLMGYNSDLFNRSTIERLVSQFISLLEQVIHNPQLPVQEIPLISDAEKERLLSKWSTAGTSLDQNILISEAFERQAEKTPQATAIIFANQTLTYGQLNAAANRLAAYLLDQGVKPEMIVSISMERCPQMIIALLAVLKSGAAFLPIDIHNPQDRIDFILADTQSPFLLTTKKSAKTFSSFNKTLIILDEIEELLQKYPTENPAKQVELPNLAYVIYTSGSTGLPKGTLISHNGLYNLTSALGERYEVKEDSRCLQFASFSFDAAVEEILTPLTHGASLVLMKRDYMLSTTELIRTIQDNRLTHLTLSPSLLSALNPKDFPDLKAVNSMGESCPPALASKWSRYVRFFNGYGPTENTVGSIIKHIDEKLSSLRVPIGKPLNQVHVYILNPAMQPVPVGLPGEIYLSGPGLARGYLNRPDLTAEKFIPNPFSKQPGNRLYRTGDLGRFLYNGEIDFIGRIDDQVQIRGNRVELGEIQANLEQHNNIQRTCIKVIKDQTGSNQIAAYVVSENGNKPSADHLKAFLESRLPAYMVPTYFLFLDKMPLNSSGKINKHALPDPDVHNQEASSSYIPPQSRLEKFLYGLWRDILKIERIGIHDNFFNLGGNSIQGAVFVNRLQEELQEYVYIVAIYDAPTIAQLCDYIIKEYPEAAQRIGGEYAQNTSIRQSKINQHNIDRLRSIIRIPDYKISPAQAAVKKNVPAVFVLSSPRSGSTLTRAMLGGHPELFSPPELQLLNYDTLQERKTVLSGRDDFWLDGTIRMIMELKNCSEDEARAIMSSFEDGNISVKQFFSEIQNWLQGRIFVDKTPNYALAPEILEQAEIQFESPKYIHLVRHPYAVIPSFEKARLHVFYPPFFTEKQTFTPRQLAEMIWTISHQNILSHLEPIPENRKIRLYYEDLVQQPEQQLRNICRFLDIDFHPDMLNPQKDSGRRMTDALNEHAKMLGDVRFHEHRGVSAERAYKWKETLTEDYLGNEAWELVESLGYGDQNELHLNRKNTLTKIKKISGNGPFPLSFAQERLWFLDQLEPGKTHYNMPVSIKVEGALNKSVLIKSFYRLAERQQSLRTVFKEIEGQAKQIILTEPNIAINEFNLTKTESKHRLSEATRILKKEARTSFNLSQGPLLRLIIIRISADEHIIQFNMHHIISDGVSMSVFIKELIAIYSAFRDQTEPQLADLPIQYADYASWQKNFLKGERLKEQLAFWKKQISGAPALLELSTDFSRPVVQSFKGKRIRFELDAVLSEGLLSLASQQNTTPFMVLVSAFNALIYRYTQQETILMGTPVANRNRREVEDLIGFFINTLILRADFHENLTYKDLLIQMQESTVAAFAHQDIPFEKIVDSVNAERNLSHNPLFQVMFAYQPQVLPESQASGLTFKPLETDTGIAKFDMTLSMAEHKKLLGGEWEYSTDLFKESTIRRMLEHFIILLEGIVANPGQSISTLPLLTGLERDQILKDWVPEPLDYPDTRCLHQMIEQQAASQPGAFAVGINDQSLNFKELNSQANQLASYLLQSGVQSESIIGILMERSTDMIVSILAIWKTGCAYLPLDPTYPQDRLNYMLKDAQAPILITHSSLTENLAEFNLQTILLDKERVKISEQSSEDLGRNNLSEALAYVIYTSGSTGKPKGVMISHRSALNLAQNLKQTIYDQFPDKNLRISLNAPIPFDASVQQVIMLAYGHGLQIIPSEIRADGEAMLEYIRTYKIQILDCVPAQLKYLLDAGLLDENQWKPLAVMPGGEAIDDTTWKKIAASKETKFYNMYGPTECTVDATICDVQTNPKQPIIGKALANTRFYILDQNNQPVPIGIPGELHISGAGLARGYLNRPELTSAKFIPDPFQELTSALMYKTGDLVRYLADGNVEFLGRLDHQVKIRGFRMELGEIESSLRSHNLIKDAVVIAKEISAGDKRLVAYLLSETNKAPDLMEVKAFLKESLPDYMIPSVFMWQDSFPLMPNGKVDKKALPDPEIERPDLDTEYVEAANDREQIFVKIWKAVLGIDKVGVKDNFFELGGDSILSIQVVARANQSGIKITPKQLFENPTIEKLATVAGSAPVTHATQGRVSGTFPLTAIQQDFFSWNLQNKHHWNQSMLIALDRVLDTDVLEQVLDHLVSHHDMLRARFPESEISGQGFIAETADGPGIQVIDFSDLNSIQMESELKRSVNQIQSSLNLTTGPLLRLVYFKTAKEKPDHLLMVIHHLIVDVVSWRIITEDMLNLYNQLSENQTANLPLKTSSFKYWAERIMDYAKSETLRTELDFWNGLSKLSVHSLPKDKQGRNTEESTQTVQVSLSSEDTDALLKEAPAAYHTRINELLITALVRAGRQWCKSNGLLIDLEGHGRENLFDDVDISRTVGWFTSVFSAYFQLEYKVDYGESIKSIKEQYRKIPNNGIGFGLLKRLNQNEIKQMPVAEIGFNYLGQFQQNSTENDRFGKSVVVPGFERSPENERKHTLEIAAYVEENGLQITFAYSKEQYFKETMQRWANQYITELKEIIKHCQDPEAGSYTPSDFQDVKLDNDELSDLLAELED